MAKDRKPVPIEVSAQVLFAQDHTCCVCRERGKSVQIHHIDDDPTNHSAVNLALLCFEDHDRTQIKGGFGKKLAPAEVVKYRDDWIDRVVLRRKSADEVAIAAMGSTGVMRQAHDEFSAPPFDMLISYIKHLPELRRLAYENARLGWDTGNTVEMRNSTAYIIDIFERVLVYLANWYPPNHFGEKGSAAYFSEFVSAKYHWHYLLREPSGPGSGGTIAGLLADGGVLMDLAEDVSTMVEALTAGDEDLNKWRKAWTRASESPPTASERWRSLWRSFRRM